MSGQGGPLGCGPIAKPGPSSPRRPGEPDDVAAARMFDAVVTRCDALLAGDPEHLGLITASEVHALRRLIVVRQEMLEQGLHRPDETIEGVRARYSDDARQQETA